MTGHVTTFICTTQFFQSLSSNLIHNENLVVLNNYVMYYLISPGLMLQNY